MTEKNSKRRGHPRIEINNVHDYANVVNDMIDDFLGGMTGDRRYLRPIDKKIDDWELVEQGCESVYTQRAMMLYDSYCRRVSKLAEKTFPETHHEFHINCSNMIEI